MEHLRMAEDSAGQAADTGSAVHAAAHAFHLTEDKSVDLALAAMRQLAPGKFPLADLGEAARMFRAYAADPRNRDARMILAERQMELRLPAHPSDPTGQEVVIFGTMDQVREGPGGEPELHDIKTGKSYDGPHMGPEHCFQLAAYQKGASEILGRPVREAYVIRVQDYMKPRSVGPVFWPVPWRWSDVDDILDLVRQEVARVRMGLVMARPGKHCDWCPAGGISSCLQIKREHKSGK